MALNEVKVLASVSRPARSRYVRPMGEGDEVGAEAGGHRHSATNWRPDVAELEHCQDRNGRRSARPRVIVLDTLPGIPSDQSLWLTDESTFETFHSLLGSLHVMAKSPHGLTMQEMSPGVWISTKSRVSPNAFGCNRPLQRGSDPYASVRCRRERSGLVGHH